MVLIQSLFGDSVGVFIGHLFVLGCFVDFVVLFIVFVLAVDTRFVGFDVGNHIDVGSIDVF